MDSFSENLHILADEFRCTSRDMVAINATSSAAVHYLAAEKCLRFARYKDAFATQPQENSK